VLDVFWEKRELESGGGNGGCGESCGGIWRWGGGGAETEGEGRVCKTIGLGKSDRAKANEPWTLSRKELGVQTK